MNTAWNFATIAFQPYPDVGEFVNVGILAMALPARVLAYRLLPAQTTARIHGFFPELDIAIYREGRKRIEVELQRLETSINTTHGVELAADQPLLPGTGIHADSLFKVLTGPRDGLFRFHAKGSRMAADPESLLDALFERYVTRTSATTDDPEEIRLVHQVGDWLEKWKLRRFYRRDVRVGPEDFHVRFPFGYQPQDVPTPQRVIKPLNLDQPSSTQIYHHGDIWVGNVSRLKRLNALPPHVMLSLKMPLATRGAPKASVKAAEEIRTQLSNHQILIADADDRKSLREFAQIREETTLILKA